MNDPFANFTSLDGPRIRLSHLFADHHEAAANVLISPTSWFTYRRGITDGKKFSDYLAKIIKGDAKGHALPLICRHRETDEILGVTMYKYPEFSRKKMEIGFTWIADNWQGTFVITELLHLMLSHAIEDLGIKRVEFSAHPQNERSNRKLKRIGADFEGTLRKWRYLEGSDDGDRNIYSIIDDEWHHKKARIQELLDSESDGFNPKP